MEISTMSWFFKLRSNFICSMFLVLAGTQALAVEDIDDLNAIEGKLSSENHALSFIMMAAYRQIDGRFDPYGAYSSTQGTSTVYQSVFGLDYRFTSVWEGY